MAQRNFLDIGTIIELVTGGMSHVKQKEGDQKGVEVDFQQLSLLAGKVLGRRAIAYFMERREDKRTEWDEAINILRRRSNLPPVERKKKKSSKFGTVVVILGAAAGAVYLLVMKPEERAALFQKIDGMINQVSGLVNELQGKPYSNDFEVKRGA
jgi:hypothetical protein